MMEVEGAIVCWSQPVQVNKPRYSTMLSDGDSKAFNELNTMQVCGDRCPVDKEECVNHVSKRLGTALRNLVSCARAKDITHSVERGRVVFGRLTSYYAIRGIIESVEVMQDAVQASFLYCTLDQ